MWYFSSQKNLNLNFHALLVVPFATAAAIFQKISVIWFNIIMKVGLPTDTIYIAKKKEEIYSNKVVYWSVEMAKVFLIASKLLRYHALKQYRMANFHRFSKLRFILQIRCNYHHLTASCSQSSQLRTHQ